MRTVKIGCILLLFCLGFTACAPAPKEDVSHSSSSLAAVSSSQSLPASGAEETKPASALENWPSYDMDSWEWETRLVSQQEGDFKISVPVGVSNSYGLFTEETAVFPESIYKIPEKSDPLYEYSFPFKLFEAYYFSSFEGYTFINETTLENYDEVEQKTSRYTLSEDRTLPPGTFYYFEEYIVITSDIRYDDTNEAAKKTIFIHQDLLEANDPSYYISFYYNEGCEEGKPLFERIVGSIEPA